MWLVDFLLSDYTFLVDYQLKIHVYILQSTDPRPVIHHDAPFSLGRAHVAVVALSCSHANLDCLEVASFDIRRLLRRFIFNWTHRGLFVYFIFSTVLFALSTSDVRWLEQSAGLVYS